jgi:hypothetical protein
VQPTWRADGRELYYLALDGTLMVVQVSPDSSRRFSQPAPLLKLGSPDIDNPGMETYAPAPDGQRFLTLRPEGEAARPTFSVIVNWQQLLTPTPSAATR